MPELWIHLKVILAAVTVMAVATSTAEAEKGRAPEKAPEIFIILELSVPGGGSGFVAVKDGRMAVYRDDELGCAIGVVPRIRDRELNLVDLEVFEVDLEYTTGTVVTSERYLDTTDAVLNTAAYVSVNGLPLQIVLAGIGYDPWEHPSLSSQRCGPTTPNHLMPRDMCCVDCGGSMYCGCSVSTSCGSCSGCA